MSIEFSFTERLERAKELEQIERLKARERMSDGGNGKENFPDPENRQSRDIVASQSGFGSGKQYEKAKFIADNALLNFKKRMPFIGSPKFS